jgi:hypothetical protein
MLFISKGKQGAGGGRALVVDTVLREAPASRRARQGGAAGVVSEGLPERGPKEATRDLHDQACTFLAPLFHGWLLTL